MPDAQNDHLLKLLERVSKRDRAAFDSFYDATSARIHAVCVAILKDRPEAEDALHEIYVAVWKDAQGATRDGLRPMTWLIVKAREVALTRLRARRRPADGSVAKPAVTMPIPATDAPKDAARAGSLNEALAKLEEPEAEALRAAYLGGLTYRDLAQRDGIPVVAVRSLLRRSLLRLKALVPA